MLPVSSSSLTITLSPAKTPTSNALILRHRLPWPRPLPLPLSSASLSAKPISRNTFTCTLRALPTQKHVYPDPSPEFAESETRKFKVELLKKLSEDVDEFGDDLDAVIDICAQIFNEFLHKEYGGPGTLLVEPFTDMLVALKKKKLPGAPLAARASLLWAQNCVDEDWQEFNQEEHPHERGIEIMFYETLYTTQPSTTQLADSEMLCKEGRHDFGLSAAGFADAALSLCLSVLIAWNSLCSYSISTQ